MSVHGTKRTSWSRQSMSALWGEAEMTWKRQHFRVWPLTEIASVQSGLPAIEVELTLAVHHPAYL
jgi:hypothetical protein